jgi:hypothetical protein
MMGGLHKPLLTTALVAAIALLAPATSSAQQEPFYRPPSWSPSAINFGKTKVEKRSEVRQVSVDPGYNCLDAGPASCYLDYNYLDLAVSGPFEIMSSSTCRYGINYTRCVVDLRFTPPSRGSHDGFLRVTGQHSKEGVGGVPLSGKGCRKHGEKLRCKPKK